MRAPILSQKTPKLLKGKFDVSIAKDLQARYIHERAKGESYCMRLFGVARTVLHQLDYGGLGRPDTVERVSSILRNL